MDLYKKFERKGYRSVIESIIRNEPDAQSLEWKHVVDKPSQPAMTSFSTTEQYVATILMGAKIVQTITEYEQGFDFDNCKVRILKQRGGTMMAVVELPEEHRKKVARSKTTTILPGDRGFLHLQYKTNVAGQDVFVEVRLQMEFIEPFPSSAPGILAAKLNHRQKRLKNNPHDNSSGRYGDMPDLRIKPKVYDLHDSLSNKTSAAFVWDTIPHVNVPANLKGPYIISYIRKQAGVKGGIDTVARHSEFVYVYQAALKMSTLEPEFLLLKFLASGGKTGRHLDIYSMLDDKTSINSDYLQLNESQRKALEMGQSAPEGFVIAHGGPGTGKTQYVMGPCLRLLLMIS